MRFFRYFVREAATPLLILAVIACLYALAGLRLAPYPQSLLLALGGRLARGEWLFIAGCSGLENTIGINGYFPGAFVILFAMAATHGKIWTALRVFGAICGGAFLGQNASYFLGRVLPDQNPSRRHNIAEILSAIGVFWHPQLGSAYSFSAGRQRMTYLRYVAILSMAWSPWNLFWGALMYNLGRVPIAAGGFLWVFAVYLLLWLCIALIRTARAIATSESCA